MTGYIGLELYLLNSRLHFWCLTMSGLWRYTNIIFVQWLITNYVDSYMGIPGGVVVKNLPTTQEIQVWSLGWEDSLEKGMPAHSSILAWRTPWTEEPYSPYGCKEWDMTEAIEHTGTCVCG